ncbi:MAG: ABC transporter permease subunit [Chloroflexi bacterium]|nr:ABC transporter permease subunit [Chloroflexota bacterium]
MFPRLFSIEWRKLSGRMLLWGEMAVLAVLILAIHIALMAVLAQPQGHDLPPEALEAMRDAMRWPQGLLNAFTFVNGGELGGLFAVVLAAALVAQEYPWRTVHVWLSRGVARGSYLLAKAAALAAALGLLVLTALLTGGIVTGAYTLHTLGQLPWGELPWGEMVRGFLVAWITLLPYASLTVFVAVLTRSTLIATGVGLGYSLLVENLAVEVLLLASPDLARVARFLPSLLANAALNFVEHGAEFQAGVAQTTQFELVEPGLACALLLGYALFGLGAAWWAFRRQDITG